MGEPVGEMRIDGERSRGDTSLCLLREMYFYSVLQGSVAVLLFSTSGRIAVAPQGTVDQPELNNERVPAKPLLMIEVSKEGPHEPAPAILSQPSLPRLRPLR